MSYPFHPFTTHFPIALLLTASALELLALRRGAAPGPLAQPLLRIGWWAGVLALASGLIDLVRQLERVEQALSWVNGHVALSLAALWIYSRPVFRKDLAPQTRARLLLLGMALLVATGLIGGHLVFRKGFTLDSAERAFYDQPDSAGEEGRMSDSALVKKLKLKPGQRAALLNAPAGYLEQLSPLPAGVELSQALDGQYDWLQLFVKNTGEPRQNFR